MIKAQELRIGNWYNDRQRDRDFVVKEIRSMSIEHGDDDYSPTRIDQINGIPLTSEWLYRLGLYWDIYWQGITDGNWVLTEGNENGTWRIAYGKTRHDIIVWNIKYVHQLQNLYQCLSGKELQLKDKTV